MSFLNQSNRDLLGVQMGNRHLTLTLDDRLISLGLAYRGLGGKGLGKIFCQEDQRFHWLWWVTINKADGTGFQSLSILEEVRW